MLGFANASSEAPVARLKMVTTGWCSGILAGDSSDSSVSSSFSGTPTTPDLVEKFFLIVSVPPRSAPKSEDIILPKNAPSVSRSITIATPMAITAMRSTRAPQKPKKSGKDFSEPGAGRSAEMRAGEKSGESENGSESEHEARKR